MLIIGIVVLLLVVMVVVEFFLPSSINKNIQDYETNNPAADRKNSNNEAVRQMSRRGGR